MAESEGYLHGNNLCSLLGKHLNFLKVLKQLTASDEGHDEVKFVFGLEEVIESQQERVVDLLQNFELEKGSFDFVSLNDVVFPQSFHGEKLFIHFVLNQKDFAEGSGADNGDDLEV